MPQSERISLADYERVRSENDRLRRENDALRPRVAQLTHDLSLERRKHKDAKDDGHG